MRKRDQLTKRRAQKWQKQNDRKGSQNIITRNTQ